MMKQVESGSANALRNTSDTYLTKDATKLINRIERIFIPSHTVTLSPEMVKIRDAMQKFMEKMQIGTFFADVVSSDRQDLHSEILSDSKIKPRRSCKGRESNVLTRQVDWDLFEISLAEDIGFVLPNEVLAEINTERTLQQEKIDKMLKEDRKWKLNERNKQPILGGKWRKTAYPLRCYDHLQEYIPTSSISELEAAEMMNELITPLSGYVGLAYNYDDQDLTEEWMLTFKGSGTKSASEHEVIRTQVEILMEVMLGHVQDRVCTSSEVLARPPLTIGVHIKEAPVWGIDSYTRRMIELAVEDRTSTKTRSSKSVRHFVEKILLPAINRQPINTAHNMVAVLQAIKEDGSTLELNKRYCEYVLSSIEENGIDSFRIHPKGTGVICIDPAGIDPHVFVSQYLGELYPSYRWCERLDVVEQAQKTFDLKPALADFYNILLERPRNDPRGYGLFYVDASQKANVGSSCSHSCDANCTSAVVARNGQLAIALTTNRRVEFGEELCMDYYSITSSDVEWKAAICLCGTTSCRGSFLHYATQDELQKVLNENCGPLWRYQSLLRACSPHTFLPVDQAVLDRHGMRASALGVSTKQWMKKYVADILRFIEYERKALPCSLMRSQQNYSFSAADMDARSVMEQRIQSMVCCISMVQQVMQQQPDYLQNSYPLVAYTPTEAVRKVWAKLVIIPDLLGKYLIKSYLGDSKQSVPQEGGPIDEEMVEESVEVKVVSGNVKSKLNMLKSVKDDVEALVREEPKSLAALRQLCFNIRDKISKICNLSTEKARLKQLCDVLVLWAHTTNYSYAQDYQPAESAPIVVVARELGTNILRSKVAPQKSMRDSGMRRRNKLGGSEASSSDVVCEQISLQSSNRSSTPVKPDEKMGRIEYGGEISPEELHSNALHDEAMDADETCIESYEVTTCNRVDEGGVEPETDIITNAGEDCNPPITAMQESDEGKVLNNISKTVCENPAISSNSPSKSSWQKEFYMSPNEPVFSSTMKYDNMFVFWQLLGWFNASTDQKSDTNLFGCVQLPDPIQCFGVAESEYGEERDTLIKLLKDDMKQTQPWPESLKASFTPLVTTSSLEKEKPLYGSPMLDGALGQVDSVSKVLALLQGSKGGKKASNNGSNGKKRKGEFDVQQLDSILPPEAPTSWVQCDSCRKWRRVAWHVDAASLPDNWVCTLNSWDIDNASCDAVQDSYDPVIESTVHIGTFTNTGDISALKVGDWRDVFCKTNKIYYEAQVMKLKPGNGSKTKAKALFHFLGWSHGYDEWVELDSERIQPHNFHTNPATKDPREQEAWQGLFGVVPVLRSALNQPRKAPKSDKSKSVKSSEISLTISAAQSSRPSRATRSTISSLSPMTATTEESQSTLAETSF